MARSLPRFLWLAILVLAAILRIANFRVADRSPDEGLWTDFGAHIADQGPGWVTRTAHDFNRGADVEFPWPQRVGYSLLVALAMRVSGHDTVAITEAVSTL